MKKIHVVPAEGFTVRDHEGTVIPPDGAAVVDSPVVQRRLREGLLIFLDGDERAPAASEETAPAPADETAELARMTKKELEAFLESAGVEVPQGATKAQLIQIAERELLEDDGAAG